MNTIKVHIEYLDEAMKNLLKYSRIEENYKALKLLPFYSSPRREASDFFFLRTMNHETIATLKEWTDWNPSIPFIEEPIKVDHKFYFDDYHLWDGEGKLNVSNIRVMQWSTGVLTFSVQNKETKEYEEYPFAKETTDQLKQEIRLNFFTRHESFPKRPTP